MWGVRTPDAKVVSVSPWRFDKLRAPQPDASDSCLVLPVSDSQVGYVLRLADLEVFEAVLEAALEAYRTE